MSRILIDWRMKSAGFCDEERNQLFNPDAASTGDAPLYPL